MNTFILAALLIPAIALWWFIDIVKFSSKAFDQSEFTNRDDFSNLLLKSLLRTSVGIIIISTLFGISATETRFLSVLIIVSACILLPFLVGIIGTFINLKAKGLI